MSKIRVRSDATEKLCSSCNVGSRLRTFRRVERASKRHQKMACIASAATATLGGIDGDIQLHGYTRSDEEDGAIILARRPRQAKGAIGSSMERGLKKLRAPAGVRMRA